MGSEYDAGRRGSAAPNNPGPGWNSSAYSQGLLHHQLDEIRSSGINRSNTTGSGYGPSGPAPAGSFGLLVLLISGALYVWPFFYRAGFSEWLGGLLSRAGINEPVFFVWIAQGLMILFGSVAISRRFPKLSFLVGAALNVKDF